MRVNNGDSLNLSFRIQVAKEDISVRFFEENQGNLIWEGFGDFQQTNVHKQVAISFRTPKYKSLDIDQTIKVSTDAVLPSSPDYVNLDFDLKYFFSFFYFESVSYS